MSEWVDIMHLSASIALEDLGSPAESPEGSLLTTRVAVSDYTSIEQIPSAESEEMRPSSIWLNDLFLSLLRKLTGSELLLLDYEELFYGRIYREVLGAARDKCRISSKVQIENFLIDVRKLEMSLYPEYS